MRSLNDDERKEVLGELLADELKTILGYVKDIPALHEEVLQLYATVNDISNRLNILEHVAKEHEPETKQTQSDIA